MVPDALLAFFLSPVGWLAPCHVQMHRGAAEEAEGAYQALLDLERRSQGRVVSSIALALSIEIRGVDQQAAAVPLGPAAQGQRVLSHCLLCSAGGHTRGCCHAISCVPTLAATFSNGGGNVYLPPNCVPCAADEPPGVSCDSRAGAAAAAGVAGAHWPAC